MGSFFGLSIARSGLFASQRGIHVTGHNISNTNTPGYTRQRLNQTEANPQALYGGKGMLGSGVEMTSIVQIRNEFLDFKIRKEFTVAGEWDVRGETLQQVEAILGEPSEDGIRKVMDNFYASLQELSEGEKADNITVRKAVTQRGIAFTKTLNHMSQQLVDLQKNTDFAIQTTVNSINGYAKEISKLNKQIFTAEIDGSHANDLRDQRNLLIDELSQLVDIEVQDIPVPNSKQSTMNILIGGDLLVSHEDYKLLKTEKRQEPKNYVDAPGLLEIKWENGSSFTCKSGQLRGFLNVRDNIDGKDKGIPYYMDQLNKFATVFASRFNMQHGKGYGLADAGTEIPFFNVPAKYTDIYDVPDSLKNSSDQDIIKDYEKKNPGKTIFKAEGVWYKTDIISAGKIDLDEKIKNDPNRIAAASEKDMPGDGRNALALLKMRHDTNMFSWGTPDDYVNSLISNVGVDGQEAKRMVDNQKVLIAQIENKRQSISGVSLDEEMGNLIKYQHAYNASARMITAVDEMLDKVINGMGVVGR
ncbi:flagellar hook-associated protein FlgK [Anaerophilus nitritogenes]|uniref:flagellar hook-associated protein FlgK n=1 Tax=Anaerophilus nitritogenes TaxID=2498136 RepID=UPI0013ED9F47|nr:flagellar hook-associated protein FlgK [Anaerophilus nitritogenes]